MGMPKSKEFYLPALKSFKDEKVHGKNEVAESVAVYLKLNDDELKEKTSGGSILRYKDRSNWAVDHLCAAKLLNKVNRGRYQISNEGLKVLNQNLEYIDEDFLMQYDSFKEYKKGLNPKKYKKDNIKEIRIIPMSNKHACCSTLDKTRDFLRGLSINP